MELQARPASVGLRQDPDARASLESFPKRHLSSALIDGPPLPPPSTQCNCPRAAAPQPTSGCLGSSALFLFLCPFGFLFSPVSLSSRGPCHASPSSSASGWVKRNELLMETKPPVHCGQTSTGLQCLPNPYYILCGQGCSNELQSNGQQRGLRNDRMARSKDKDRTGIP